MKEYLEKRIKELNSHNKDLWDTLISKQWSTEEEISDRRYIEKLMDINSFAIEELEIVLNGWMNGYI